MVFEVLSPKQGKQFHFFACGKGVSHLSRLFGKESLNYMCGIKNIFLFENLSLDGVPTPCPNFRLGPPSPTGFYMIALKAATAAIVAIYAKNSFRKSTLFIASTDFSSRLILVKFTISLLFR